MGILKKISILSVSISICIVSTATSLAYDQFKAGTNYQAGNIVENAGGNYKCKPWPYTGWCKIGSSYEPGVGFAWTQAWEEVGSTVTSSGPLTPTPEPIPTPSVPTTPTTPSTPTQTTPLPTSHTLPGTPSIAWIQDTISSPNFEITWNMWWGENGTTIKLQENGNIIQEDDLVANSPRAQQGIFQLRNKPQGEYNYIVYLCNKNLNAQESCVRSNSKKISRINTVISTPITPTIPTQPSTPGVPPVVSIPTPSAPTPTPVVQQISPEIQRIIASAKPIAGIPTIDVGNPQNNPENVQRVMKFLTKDKWNTIFPVRKPVYQYKEFLKAIAKFPALCGEKGQYTSESLDTICKKELASIFAHATQETGGHSKGSWLPDNPGVKVPEWKQGLYYITEVGCENGGCEYRGGTCEANTWQGKTWSCPVGAKYYGRGAKQLSYNYNYGPFSKVMFGDVNVLLKNPDKVAQEGWLAISSAIWFYMTPQSPKPSMHDVVAGFWKPNQNDINAGISAGFGATINIINGGIECGPAQKEIAQAQNRISYYKEFTREFGVSIDPNEVLGCKDQARFPGNGAGSIPTYWERDWSKDGACKLVTYQTPHTIFDEGSYNECVSYHFGKAPQAQKIAQSIPTEKKETTSITTNVSKKNTVISSTLSRKESVLYKQKIKKALKNSRSSKTDIQTLLPKVKTLITSLEKQETTLTTTGRKKLSLLLLIEDSLEKYLLQ